MKNKLEMLLNQGAGEEECEPSVVIKRNPISQAYITRSALKKAKTYARLVCDIMETSSECYGYLITPMDKRDRIVRDVYFAPKQEVGPADVTIPAESVVKSGKEIEEMGYKVLGWWHSHADFEPFHSGTDDENMMKVLNAIGAANTISTYRQMPLVEGKLDVRRRGSNIEVYDTNNPDRRVRLNIGSEKFNTKDLRILKDISVNMPVRIGFAYSIVVNALGSQPYCEIATKDFCGLCYGGEEKSVESKLRVVNQDSFRIDEKEIAKDIKKKIRKPRRYSMSKSWYETGPTGIWGGKFGGFSDSAIEPVDDSEKPSRVRMSRGRSRSRKAGRINYPAEESVEEIEEIEEIEDDTSNSSNVPDNIDVGIPSGRFPFDSFNDGGMPK